MGDQSSDQMGTDLVVVACLLEGYPTRQQDVSVNDGLSAQLQHGASFNADEATHRCGTTSNPDPPEDKLG
ncbi:hypothetical protein [Mycolicibacterium sp. CBMA 226]|uniref:hypothetical protein n=1 Tax=Mycolicibacterium sp. CBMA 226 TaxID=2606611 RepID=UPI0012DE8A0F|nr:hypothetical protein [Mycolicibacterium sp. CBMA 226]